MARFGVDVGDPGAHPARGNVGEELGEIFDMVTAAWRAPTMLRRR